MEIVPEEPLRPGGGRLKARGVAKYSHFGSIEGYISEMVQDRRRWPLFCIILPNAVASGAHCIKVVEDIPKLSSTEL